PKVRGMPPDTSPAQRSLFTLVPSLEFAERCYDIAKLGEIPEQLWIDCVVASNVDETLAPKGRHIMTCFVQYVPYFLRCGSWDENRELLGSRVIRRSPNMLPMCRERLWRGRYSHRSIWSAFMGLPREIFSTETSRSSSFSSCALYQVGPNTAVPLPGCICVVRAHIPEGA